MSENNSDRPTATNPKRMQARLDWLKDLGAENAARSLARRIQFVNLSGALGVFVTVVWGLAGAIIHFWPLVWLNLVAIAGYGLTVVFNRRQRWRLARHVLYWTATYHMGLAAVVLPGNLADSHIWFLIIAAAAFLLPDAEETAWRRYYAPLSLALYFVLGFNVFGIEPIRDMPDGYTPYVKLAVQVSFVTVSAYLLTMFYRDLANAESLLEQNNRKSRNLLRNILPALISDRLEAGEGAIAEANPSVTVVFADIVGFTPLAANTSAESLVQLLNDVFSSFDDLAILHGVEKIKTIGDAYMVAAGVPEPVADHAERAARFALAIREAIRRLEPQDGVKLDLRIGIHSGPVVAGVIGKTKFSYDLWGDAVNTAARMESHSLAGQIQVSEATYKLLPQGFVLQARGAIEIKGKGAMNTWFLEAFESRPNG